MVLKSAKRGRQRSWAHTQWRLGHSSDLGAHTVEPKYQVLCGLTSDNGIHLISGRGGVLLRAGFGSDVVLGFRLMYFNNFKFGA